MSQWIWRYGEFECYHNMILHTRREQYGYNEPVVWKLYAPEQVVCFKKKVTTEGGTFRIHTEKGFVIFISIPKRDKM